MARLSKSAADYARTRARAREAAYEALLAAGRTTWRVGERVRFYRAADGSAIWLPDVPENDTSQAGDAPHTEQTGGAIGEYDVAHYLGVLHISYVSRLRKAFAADDFEQLFRSSGQAGLFDRPIGEVQPLWIRA